MTRLANIFEKIFYALFSNAQKDEDSSYIVNTFKEKNLEKDKILNCFTHPALLEFEKEKALLSDMSLKASSSRGLLELMKVNSSMFSDEVFKRLLFVIHDSGNTPIRSDMTVPIISGGQIKNMNLEQLEEKLIEEVPDLMTTQTCIPEHPAIDAEFLDSEILGQRLKKLYEKNLEVALAEKLKDNPKSKELKENQIRDTEKQVLTAIKNTEDANILKKRKADKAEFTVQEAIAKAAKVHQIPLVAFRNVCTYQHIGKNVRNFGIQCSKLKGIFKSEQSASEECEHDVMIVAPLPSTTVVVFIQVSILFYKQHSRILSLGENK